MTFYSPPETELTEAEKLLAAVIGVSQRMPCGVQIGLPMHLDKAMECVEQLFTEHQLPLKDTLLDELRLWKAHAEQGLKFSEQCDLLMQQVIRWVDSTCQR